MASGSTYGLLITMRKAEGLLSKAHRASRRVITPERELLDLAGLPGEALHLALHAVVHLAKAPAIVRVVPRPAVDDRELVVDLIHEFELTDLLTPSAERLPAPMLCRDLPPNVVVSA
jgi:hypothetical protein